MREYLTFASPGEFASRNIFTEERPLRRARGPRPSAIIGSHGHHDAGARAVQDGASPRLATPSSQTGDSSLYSFCVSSNVIAVSSTPNDFMTCFTFSLLPPATSSFDSF